MTRKQYDRGQLAGYMTIGAILAGLIIGGALVYVLSPKTAEQARRKFVEIAQSTADTAREVAGEVEKQVAEVRKNV